MTRQRRLLSVALSLVTLLGLGYVVAVAARRKPGSTDGPLLDFEVGFDVNLTAVAAWVVFILAIVGAVLIVLGLREVKPRQERRRRSIVGIVVGLIVFLVVFRLFQPVAADLLGAAQPGAAEEAAGDGGQVAGGPVGWLFSLLVAAVAAAALTRVGMSVGEAVFDQPTRPARSVPPIPTAPGAAPPVPLDDDPRGRVLVAYNRFEETAGDAGLVRGKNETASRHARRVEGGLGLDPQSVIGLMTRYSKARFGESATGEDDAVAAERDSAHLVEEMKR